MIIVTGGAGLIGSAIVWRLNQLGRDDILIIDHLGQSEKWKNLVSLKYRDYIEKDDFLELLEREDLATFFGCDHSGIDAVFHLGACSSTTELDATYLVRNNFEYSKKLANFALKNSARFIYASSAATYGDGDRGFNDEGEAFLRLKPLNMYGYSKQMFDMWAYQNGVLDQIVGLKYFNVFGPNEYHKGDMKSLVVKAFEQILATGQIQLFKSHRPEYADGEQMRDFVYVKDVADMTLHFFENRKANGLFNIGSGTANTWNALAQGIFDGLGKSVNIEYVDMPESIREKYQYYTCADISKLRKAGYDREGTPLAEAVKDYVQNYLLTGGHLEN